MNITPAEKLIQALPAEMRRVLDLASSIEETNEGKVSAMLMRLDVKKAHKAMTDGDYLKMLSLLNSLREWG